MVIVIVMVTTGPKVGERNIVSSENLYNILFIMIECMVISLVLSTANSLDTLKLIDIHFIFLLWYDVDRVLQKVVPSVDLLKDKLHRVLFVNEYISEMFFFFFFN